MMQLVILAAGIGRRFGGLKQLAPVGPCGEALLDYTVFDALRSGFDRVVLVIRDEIEAEVRNHVERGLGKHVHVSYAYQATENPRSRPWGTSHAVLAAREQLTGPFAVANADDLYGAPAIAAIGSFLEKPTEPATWAVVGFPICGTLPDQGTVSRALITAERGWMQSIDEVLNVCRHANGACLTDRDSRIVPADSSVSMNLWGFDLRVLADLEIRFRRFLDDDPDDEDEFQLPVSVGYAIQEDRARVRVLPTTSQWCGMTSATDLAAVRANVRQRIDAGDYPESLWAG
jgi:hypothetical protein